MSRGAINDAFDGFSFGGRFIEAFNIVDLVSFSDSFGKPVWQIVSALEDFEKGEFERMKEFGIRVDHLTLDYVVSHQGRDKRIAKSLIVLMNHLKEIIK
jgi:hypothetical protein